MWCRPPDGRPSPKGVRVDTPKKVLGPTRYQKKCQEVSKECRCENGRHPWFTKGCRLRPFKTRPGPLKYLAHPRHPSTPHLTRPTSHPLYSPPAVPSAILFTPPSLSSFPTSLPPSPPSIPRHISSPLPFHDHRCSISHRSREVAGISLSIEDTSARLRNRRVLFPRLLRCLEALPCSTTCDGSLRLPKQAVQRTSCLSLDCSNGSGVCICSVCVSPHHTLSKQT